jgi:hypothetical protein
MTTFMLSTIRMERARDTFDQLGLVHVFVAHALCQLVSISSGSRASVVASSALRLTVRQFTVVRELQFTSASSSRARAWCRAFPASRD